jgi:L-ascorbate metabolism protein UlaG (beta-lactamase superfamily)
MKITKFGHSCLLIEDSNTRLIIDPGSFSSSQNTAQNIQAIFITHIHQDHCDIESIKAILALNPAATIYTNVAVGEELSKHNIAFTLAEAGADLMVGSINVKAFGTDHAIISPSMPIAANTGYLFNNKLFHPGDAFTIPNTPIEILAFPLTAPWSNIGQTMEYLENFHPKICFPIHDAILSEAGLAVYQRLTQIPTQKTGTEYKILELNKEYEL